MEDGRCQSVRLGHMPALQSTCPKHIQMESSSLRKGQGAFIRRGSRWAENATDSMRRSHRCCGHDHLGKGDGSTAGRRGESPGGGAGGGKPLRRKGPVETVPGRQEGSWRVLEAGGRKRYNFFRLCQNQGCDTQFQGNPGLPFFWGCQVMENQGTERQGVARSMSLFSKRGIVEGWTGARGAEQIRHRAGGAHG